MKNKKTSCICLICKIEFVPLKYANKRTKYCSQKCKSKDYYWKYYIHFVWKKERECLECNKKFIPETSQQMGCSKKCGRKYARRKWKKANWDKVLKYQSQLAREKTRVDWKEKNCVRCKKVFLPNLGNKNSQIYCSAKCRIKSNSEKALVTGKKKLYRKKYKEKHYDEVVRRESEYKERIRFADGTGSKSLNRTKRLKIDKYICRKCGEDNYKTLIVHHNKYPAKVKDLITLCRSCHLHIHQKLEGKFYLAYKTK